MASSSVFLPAGLSDKKAKAAISKALISGYSIDDQFDALSASAKRKFIGTIQLSIQSGETLGQMAARLSGGTVNGVAVPGFLKLTRAQSTALAHTAVTAISKQDRLEAFQANSDVIKAVQQLSTLDNRTTDICISYSDLTWDIITLEPIGHSLPWAGGPPRHFNCRSVIIPVLKSPAELGVKTRGKIAPEVRASMDGQIPASTTFDKWLSRKPLEFIEDLIGKAAAALFTKGKLKLVDLIKFNARPLAVKALAAATSQTGFAKAQADFAIAGKPLNKALVSKASFDVKLLNITQDPREAELMEDGIRALKQRLVLPQGPRTRKVTESFWAHMNAVTFDVAKAPNLKYAAQYFSGEGVIKHYTLGVDAYNHFRNLVHEFGHHIHMDMLNGSPFRKFHFRFLDIAPASRVSITRAYEKMLEEYQSKTYAVAKAGGYVGDLNSLFSPNMNSVPAMALEKVKKGYDVLLKDRRGVYGAMGVTSYAHTNELEWFAESFSYYFGAADEVNKLKEVSPAAFNFFETLLREFGG